MRLHFLERITTIKWHLTRLRILQSKGLSPLTGRRAVLDNRKDLLVTMVFVSRWQTIQMNTDKMAIIGQISGKLRTNRIDLSQSETNNLIIVDNPIVINKGTEWGDNRSKGLLQNQQSWSVPINVTKWMASMRKALSLPNAST